MNKPKMFLRHRNVFESKKPSRSEVIKESVKAVSKQYCKESSICGLKHLVNENTSFIERIIWIVILLMALVCSVSLVWITFANFYGAPLVTTQMPEGVSVSKIIFPAVGVCSNNRISKKAVTELAQKLLKEERNKKYNLDSMLNLLHELGNLYNMQLIGGDITRPQLLQKALGEYDINKLMKDLSPRCEDLLVACAWNEEPMNCSNLFDFRLTATGYCCTFNYLRQSDTFEDSNNVARSIDMYNYGNKSSFDYDQGLKMLLRFHTSDDFFYRIPLEGAQLQFSDAYDFPDGPSGSFAIQIISTNVLMNVAVTASFTEASRDIEHIPLKIRDCLFHDESPYLQFYTFSDCMLKCRMLFLLEKCNCTPFTMPKMKNTRTCDIGDLACMKKYYGQSITLRPALKEVPPEFELDLVEGGISCPMCYPTCSKTVYWFDFNNVDMFPDTLNLLPDSERSDWLQGVNFTGTSIVHVGYAKELASCFGQNVIMKWFDLISNIGSTCGFVTGFSFVSVLEFVYFYTVRLIREVRTRRNQNRHGLAQNATSLPFEPITRYRPIYWNELASSTTLGQNSFSNDRLFPQKYFDQNK